MIKERTSKVVKHTPCPCGASRDNFAVYDDGHAYCFTMGCGKYISNIENTPLTPLDKECYNYERGSGGTTLRDTKGYTIGINNKDNNPTMNSNYTIQNLKSYRGLTEATLKKYQVTFRIGEDGTPLGCVYPYGKGESNKIRNLLSKGFYSEGNISSSPLFGKEIFPPGSAKAITITEGENDAMSCFQMQGSTYPCVSVRSATSARQDCEKEFKYLNSFSLIYICFDADSPGLEAAKEVAALFDVSKVRIVRLDESLKDANGYLEAKREEEFRKAWWNAKQFLPEGVISTYEEIKNILSKERQGALVEYPFETLQEMTYGIRSKEVVLLTAMEGIGKTEVIRAIEYKVLKDTDYNIGIIHLEEEDKRSVQGLASYELGSPCHLPDSNVSIEEQFKAYEALTRRDGRVFYYSHFGTDDPKGVLDVIRYLVGVCHCKFIFLDHITMMVTGLGANGENDERRLLDYLSTQLAMMVHQYDFALVMISHINDDGKTRGSRNISKICHLHVQLDRDKLAETFDMRNTTKLTIHKNRFGYKTGEAGYLLFDPSTFTIKEKKLNNDGTTSQSVSPF